MKLDADSTKAKGTNGQAAGPWNRGRQIGKSPHSKCGRSWFIRIRLQLSAAFRKSGDVF